MKKMCILILSVVMGISLCACGKTTTAEKGIVSNEIGDAVSTDAAELVLLNVSYEDTFGSVTPKEGYSFVVVDYTLKNIGKTDFGYFLTATGGRSMCMESIVSIDYNDGYIFYVDDVEGADGKNYDKNYMYQMSDYLYIRDLKPLSDAVTVQAAICVPNEVIENTDAPLLIKFNLLNANEEDVTAVYSIR